MTNINTSDLLSLKDAAAKLHVHSATLRKAILAGKLQAVRLGKGNKLQTTDAWIQEYLQSCMVIVQAKEDQAND